MVKKNTSNTKLSKKNAKPIKRVKRKTLINKLASNKGESINNKMPIKRAKRKTLINKPINNKTASNKPVSNKSVNNKSVNNKWKHVTNLNSTEEHMLDDHGYKNVMSLSKEQRKDAIMSIIKHLTPIKGQLPTMLYIITALNARYLFYRVTDPTLAKIFKTDQRMVTSMHRRMKRTAKRLMHTNSKHTNAV
jgi:hypothetical protein